MTTPSSRVCTMSSRSFLILGRLRSKVASRAPCVGKPRPKLNLPASSGWPKRAHKETADVSLCAASIRFDRSRQGQQMSVNQEAELVSGFFGSMFPHHGYRTLSGPKILADPGFGRFFSDHMSIIYWDANKGWHGACITELRPFTLHPGCVALHYAQGVFEGLKAYGGADGSVWLFRPLLNARRFRESAARLALPQLSDDLFLSSLISLVQVDRAWVPRVASSRVVYESDLISGTGVS